MILKRRLLAIIAAHVGVTIAGCTGGTIEIRSLTLDNIQGDELIIVAELDRDLLSKSYARHEFGFSYNVLEQSQLPASLPKGGTTITSADLEIIELAMAETLRNNKRGRYPGEFKPRATDEHIKDRLASGLGIMRALGDADGPPFRYAIVLPLHPPPGRPELAHSFKRPGMYAIALRIDGAVPTFGYPFVPSTPVDSNVRGVIVDLRQ